ncbi:MAG: type VI secretion system tip protein VgrG [Prolixibacteraceae bacterium]|jgi:Rhs element Vgr protein
MPTNLKPTDGVVSFDILINGAKIKDEVEVYEISLQMEINRISSAIVVIGDGGPAIGLGNDPFSNSEGNDFIPGNEITISLGYDSKTTDVFKGIITAQNLTVKSDKSQLTITCKDKAVKMTKGRFNSIFQDKKDSDAISSIAGLHGLSATVDATTVQHPALAQYNCSDWDFVVTRAELSNMIVLTDSNSLVVKKINFSDTANFEINATQVVIDIDLSLDSENVASDYELTSWDDKTQQATVSSVSISSDLSLGNIAASKLSQAIHSGNINRFSSARLTTDELKLWGDSLASKAVLSKIQGKITIPGVSGIKAGDIVVLSGFSARFNGNAYITKVGHSVQDGNWLTTLYVGKYPQWHAALPEVADQNASGLLPPVNGSQIATVKKIDQDPDGSYRVQIILPAFTGTGQDNGIWARIVFPYASADAGFFFFPEIGDEVLVTFINDDPRYPIITGALYSTKNKPKETPDAKNQFKSIYTKSGINIRFDDEDKILTIKTPGGHSFTMDDKNKNIIVEDLNKNKLTMSDAGISMESPKDIKLNAKGNVDITATSNISLNATGDTKVDGMNVALTAKTGLTAKGNATAEISASGQTTVKGGIVMIN